MNVLLISNQHWLREWLVAVRQQAIAWATVDQYLCHYMASLVDNELIASSLSELTTNWVITGSTDGLSPAGARVWAGTGLKYKVTSDFFFFKVALAAKDSANIFTD